LEKPDGNGIGLGLENARKRLRLLCGDAAYLKLTGDSGVVTAEVWIPRCAR
jgi:sensor histidine kinase YesM